MATVPTTPGIVEQKLDPPEVYQDPKPKRGRPPKSVSAAGTAIEIVKPKLLALADTPEFTLEEAAKAAKALAQAIESSPQPPVLIRGQRYLRYEHWQTVGRFYGVTAKETSSSYVEHGTKKGYEASADALLVSTNQVIGHADSQCMDDEPEWARKPSFQVRSMAQTRACAKALRSIFSWVVVLAGYNPTPVEEMMIEGEPLRMPQGANGRTTQPTVDNPAAIAQQAMSEVNDDVKLVTGIEQSIREAKSMEDLIARNKVAFRMGEKAANPDWVHAQLKKFRDAKKQEFPNAKN